MRSVTNGGIRCEEFRNSHLLIRGTVPGSRGLPVVRFVTGGCQSTKQTARSCPYSIEGPPRGDIPVCDATEIFYANLAHIRMRQVKTQLGGHSPPTPCHRSYRSGGDFFRRTHSESTDWSAASPHLPTRSAAAHVLASATPERNQPCQGQATVSTGTRSGQRPTGTRRTARAARATGKRHVSGSAPTGPTPGATARLKR